MVKVAEIAEAIAERLNVEGIECRAFGAEEDDQGILRPFVVCGDRMATIHVGQWEDWSKFEEAYQDFKKHILMDKEMQREHIGTA